MKKILTYTTMTAGAISLIFLAVKQAENTKVNSENNLTIQTLNTKYEKLQKEKDDILQALAILRAQLTTANTKIEELNVETASKQVTIINLNNTIEKHLKTINDKNLEITSLNIIIKAQSNRIELLNSEITLLNKEVEHKNSLISSNKNIIKQLNADIIDLKNQNQNISSTNEALNKEINIKIQKILVLESDNKALDESLSNTKDALSLKSTELENKIKEYNQLDQDYLILETSKAELQSRYDALVTERDGLSKDLADANSKISDLKIKVIALEKTIVNHEATIKQKNQEISKLQSQLQTEIDLKNNYRIKSEMLQNKVNGLENDLNEIHDKIEDIIASVPKFENKSVDFTANINTATGKNEFNNNLDAGKIMVFKKPANYNIPTNTVFLRHTNSNYIIIVRENDVIVANLFVNAAYLSEYINFDGSNIVTLKAGYKFHGSTTANPINSRTVSYIVSNAASLQLEGLFNSTVNTF